MFKKTIYTILEIICGLIAFVPTIAGLYAINLLVWYPMLGEGIIGSWRFGMTFALLLAAWVLAQALQAMYKSLAKNQKKDV